MSGPSGLASRRRRELLAALAASGATVGVAGCSGLGGQSEDDASNAPGDHAYIVGSTSAASGGLDPLAVGDAITTQRLGLIYDGGGVVDDDPIDFQGRWLADWQLSEDAQTVRYTVRDGLEWGAGYGQLTAETYVYNVRNVFTAPWAQYTQATFYTVGGEPIEYEQTGELTFEAHLPEPRANFLHEDPVPGALLLPIDLVEQYAPADDDAAGTPETPVRDQIADDPDVRNANLVGNLGPFTLDRYEQGERMVVRANDDYYLAETDVGDGAFRDSPKLDGVTVHVFGEQSTAYSALKAGDITTTGLEARRKAEFEETPGVKVWSSTFGEGIYWISINHRANGWAPLRESREVRQALAHLLDKETLVEDIYDGNANPIDTFHPRWGPYYSDGSIQQYPPDVERARELLDSGTSSEYGFDDDGRFLGPDGEQVELRFVTRSDIQTGDLVGNFVRGALEEAGFSVAVEGLPFGRILQTYLTNSVENNPNFDGEPDWGPVSPYNGGPWDQAISPAPWDFIWGVGATGSIAYAGWLAIQGFVPERAPFNAFGYHTDGFDFAAAIDEAASAPTREEATAVMEELLGYLSQDLPLLWTTNNHRIRGYRDGVTGLPEVRNFFSEPNVRLVGME